MAGLLPFPDIGEVAFSLGPLEFRYYGLAYAVGLLLGWYYVRQLVSNTRLWGGNSGITAEDVDDFLIWATLAVVLGGRIGYVLFYQPSFYLQNPEQIFYLNKGGMAFHGAAIAVTLVAIWFARRRGLPILSLTDVVTASVPIGLFFGRLANFVNGELWGRVTDVPWAMIFPGADDQPRHPSQLYEAALEGLLLFIILRLATHYFMKLQNPGFVTGLFLAGYGIARSVVEHFFRQPDLAHPVSVNTPLTPGLLYSIPMIALGLYLIWRSQRKAV
ncbi:MAG: prolipoprotein diacylglyceryl transferase [Rhodomicrobium sp.]|nr:MAG: prolipoprotein diacylglyceryl transferase [Rhodomicrobium sp.]